MGVGSEIVNRQLVMCLAMTLDTPIAIGTALQKVMTQLTALMQGKAYQKAKLTIRCLKMVLRIYQYVDWESATDESEVLPSPEVIKQLDAAFTRLILNMQQLLHVCTQQKLYEFRKLVAHVILVYIEDDCTSYMLSELWKSAPAGAAQFCQVVVAIMREAAPEDIAHQALFFKTKARLSAAWTLMLTDILPPGDGSQHDASAKAIVATLLQADAAMITVFLTILDQELPGLDDDRDSALFHAFEQCAVAVMDCISHTPSSPQLTAHRQATLVPHAQALLTRVFFRFLCVSGADVALIGADPEEYARRSADEFKHALTCPHGARKMFDCDICAHGSSGGESSSRSAAMAASRELIRLIPGAAVTGVLTFVSTQLATPITGTEVAQVNALSQRGGALRAFAAVADRLCSGLGTAESHPAAQQTIVAVIRGVLIPETTRTPTFEFAAHLRCIACTVLERFVEYLSKQVMLQDMANAIQAIMTCLCDQSEAVRIHALTSLDEMVKWRTDLVYNLEMISSEAMNWLAALLEDEAKPANAEIMQALMTFLYKYDGNLGDVGPKSQQHCGCRKVWKLEGDTHPVPCKSAPHHTARFHSILKAHGQLFTTLCRRFHALRALVIAGTASADQLRLMCLLIEVIHALVISAPKNPAEPSSVHPSLLPLLLPYATGVMDPRILAVAATFDKDADAVDVIGTLPASNTQLWAALLERILQTVVAAPQHAELVIPMVCEFLHNGDGRTYLFEGGGLARIQPIVHKCLTAGPAGLKCRSADLYRSIIVISARATYDTSGEVVWSYWRLAANRTAPAAVATQERGPLVASLFAAVPAILQAFTADTTEPDPIVRTMCAVCAALYVDPKGCMPALQQQVQGTKASFMVLLVHFWSKYWQLIDLRRTLDLQICSLGLCSAIRMLLDSGVAIVTVVDLLQAAISLVSKFKGAQQANLYGGVDDGGGGGGGAYGVDDGLPLAPTLGDIDDEDGNYAESGNGSADSYDEDFDEDYDDDGGGGGSLGSGGGGGGADLGSYHYDVEYFPDLEDLILDQPVVVLQELCAYLQQKGTTPAQLQALVGQIRWQQLATIFKAK